jgi:hypothetical protein
MFPLKAPQMQCISGRMIASKSGTTMGEYVLEKGFYSVMMTRHGPTDHEKKKPRCVPEMEMHSEPRHVAYLQHPIGK